ncbi:MAG: trypsin-like peptidase domain-containing protein [Candidatus Omnitrophica bacterium]|nr:trypsin-like peptidase domain-containing protein [Candidatus Omnitrophota bacterium]MCA9415666.1 trypsin-like peptidase domain-containing protein [Candidatus Omnitrophota bacterium]
MNKTTVGFVISALLVGIAAQSKPLDFERRTPVVQVAEKLSQSVITIKTDVRKQILVDPFQGFGLGRNWGMGSFIQEKNYSSAGSGVIVNHDGIVITNAHVVQDANRLTGTTTDGEEYDLTMIGVDNDFDLAVLQIEPKPNQNRHFPDIDWGTSSDLMMGETVVLMGSALTFQNSVSVGVVSAVERMIEVPNRPEPYFGMIQTDAAINRGNSGGPLVNIRGELIGIATLIATEGGGSDGIGFAIPVERVKQVYEEFVEGMVSLEERLGLRMVNPYTVERIHPSQAERLGLKAGGSISGLLAIKLEPHGLAVEAGLQESDLLIQVDGKDVSNRSEFWRALEEHEIGTPLIATVLRVDPNTGQVDRINIPIPTKGMPGAGVIEQIDSWFGMNVAGITNEIADKLDVPIDEGVVVVSVDGGSAAGVKGLSPGTLIQGIEGYKIQTIGDFRRLRHMLQDRGTVKFQIRQGNRVGEVSLSRDWGSSQGNGRL